MTKQRERFEIPAADSGSTSAPQPGDGHRMSCQDPSLALLHPCGGTSPPSEQSHFMLGSVRGCRH